MTEEVISFEKLYESMLRCRKGVSWKNSVAHFYLNGIEETIKLEKELKTGTYKQRPQKKILITHPKRREAVSIAFRDRVYQRSLNDNEIYPRMAKSFIYDNAACQKGKGTDFLRNRLDESLRHYYRKYGNDGYVLQCDVRKYYETMRHDVAEECFKRYLPDDIFVMAKRVLRKQYDGDTGYNPGSQMVQIAGISVLSPMDHFVSERLNPDIYKRYMDDFILISPDKKFLEDCKDQIGMHLEKIGFELHPKKTRIYELKEGIKILGFTHKLTDTGKVIRLIDSDNVKSERRKLRRMVHKAKKGEIPTEKVNECYKSWKAHASKGNTFKVIQRMDRYYKELWKEEICST